MYVQMNVQQVHELRGFKGQSFQLGTRNFPPRIQKVLIYMNTVRWVALGPGSTHH